MENKNEALCAPGKLVELLQERGPLLGPKSGLENELSEEIHKLTKQAILLEWAPRQRAVG